MAVPHGAPCGAGAPKSSRGFSYVAGDASRHYKRSTAGFAAHVRMITSPKPIAEWGGEVMADTERNGGTGMLVVGFVLFGIAALFNNLRIF